MRNRTLAIKRFEALEIPLPPIEEQRRVAARLDSTAAHVQSLRGRSASSEELAQALAVSVTNRPDLNEAAKTELGWRRVILDSVLTPTVDSVVVVEPDRSYPNLGIRSFGNGLFRKADIDGGATSARSLHRVRAGQFIYSRLFAFEGAYGLVTQEFDGSFVSNEFPTFEADPRSLDTSWLATHLRSPDHWGELAATSKGLGVRRQRVPVDALLAYTVWLPPIEQQREMVTAVRRLRTMRDAGLTVEKRVNALVPAALNDASVTAV